MTKTVLRKTQRGRGVKISFCEDLSRDSHVEGKARNTNHSKRDRQETFCTGWAKFISPIDTISRLLDKPKVWQTN